MSEEVYARLMLALIGLALGTVPMVYGIIRKQILAGIAAAVVCAGVSAVGLPYACLLLAPGAFYLIYVLARNKDDADRKKHRAAYKKHIRQELQSPDIRTSGMVENRDAANTAWPPVDQVMDAQAAEEYQQLAANEEAARVQPDTSQPS